MHCACTHDLWWLVVVYVRVWPLCRCTFHSIFQSPPQNSLFSAHILTGHVTARLRFACDDSAWVRFINCHCPCHILCRRFRLLEISSVAPCRYTSICSPQWRQKIGHAMHLIKSAIQARMTRSSWSWSWMRMTHIRILIVDEDDSILNEDNIDLVGNITKAEARLISRTWRILR